MPELALFYLVGFISCGMLSILHFLLIYKKINSTKYIKLQKNLKQLNLYWSENSATIKVFIKIVILMIAKETTAQLLSLVYCLVF